MTPPGSDRHPFRFRPENRLRRKQDIERALRTGRRWTTSHLVVRLLHKTDSNEPPRLGLAISRKVGNSVVRNRVRRRIREAFRLSLPRIAPGWDLVVSAKPEAAASTFQQLQAELHEALGRFHAWAVSSD
ncbi:MAG: ribonuclease P protein component [Candidatus Sumerlaeia bacterium]|nr:ribonuclease P protein component [Candidatus Sumerlaeia bacterium]